MVYICNICEKEYNSYSCEDLEEFCKHVAKCPLRSDNFLVERFKCKVCGNVVQIKQSFRAHLLKCNPPNQISKSSGYDKATTSKQKRNTGKINIEIASRIPH